MEREEIAGSLLQVVPPTPSGEDVLEGGSGAFTNFYAPAADLPSFRLLAESAMTTIGLRVIDFGTPTYVDTDLEQPAEANEALASVRAALHGRSTPSGSTAPSSRPGRLR
jgi:hypothetical protein